MYMICETNNEDEVLHGQCIMKFVTKTKVVTKYFYNICHEQ